MASPVFGDPWGVQGRIAVTSDHRGTFAVWDDSRVRHTHAIVGSRLDATGQPVDPHNIFIAREAFASLGTVANGGSYSVFWSTSFGANPDRLRATRVSRGGVVLGEPRTLVEGATFIGNASLAGNGSRTLVGYMDSEGHSRALLVDEELNVLANVLLPTSSDAMHPVVAANGSNFAAIWSVYSGGNLVIEGVRISASGTLLDTAPIRVGEGTTIALASDGSDFIALSHQGDGRRFTFAIPANLQNASAAYAIPDGERYDFMQLLFDGEHYVVIGPRLRSGVLALAATDIGRNGIPGETEELNGTPAFTFAATAIEGDLLALWRVNVTPEDSTQTRIYARRFGGPSLEPEAAAKQVTFSAPYQEGPQIAANGTSYVVTWKEDSGLYAARLGADGVSLDGRGILLTRERHTSMPEVVWDGLQYIVSYSEGIDAVAVDVLRFITPSQGLLDERVVGAGMPLATGPDNVTLLLAPGGVRRFFGATRTFENATVRVAPEGERTADYRASWNGSDYLVTWAEQERDPSSWQFDFYIGVRIRGARLSRNLTLLDTTPITIGDVPGTMDQSPALATDGKDWLVTWESDYGHVRAQRVLANGTRGGNVQGTLVATGFGVDVTFDGTRYVLAWKGGTAWIDDDPSQRQPLTVGTISRAGTLTALTTLTPTDMPTGVSITRSPTGAVAAYSRLDASTGGAPRVFVQGIESIQGRRRAVR
ncbi:MAG TPA: hypothetical protein VEK11_23550 [Thermoanaerobaculia bacterium]|nr:hypothetical protein [Thermoanaerobaculia bacterium]